MIAVLGQGSPDGARSLARGLRRLGEAVVLGALDREPPAGDDFTIETCAMTSGGEVAGVLVRAEAATGPLEAVVLVSTGTAATVKGGLADLDPEQWRTRVEVPLQRTLACFQGAHRQLRARGGCLLVLVPTLSLVGAPGSVPWAAVAEAQRALAKSAARAWGADRITVNCLAVPGVLLRPAPGAPDRWGADPDRPGLPPPSLDPLPDMDTTVAPVVVSLVTSVWNGVSGATIAVDGGVWMTP